MYAILTGLSSFILLLSVSRNNFAVFDFILLFVCFLSGDFLNIDEGCCWIRVYWFIKIFWVISLIKIILVLDELVFSSPDFSVRFLFLFVLINTDSGGYGGSTTADDYWVYLLLFSISILLARANY